MNMKITVKGSDELQAAFAKAPGLLADLTGDAIETSSKLIKERARRKAGSPPIVNTGELARGIDYQMRGNFSSRVGADARYSPFVEFGRGPGGFPPVAAIEKWARSKIGISGLGFIIARKIARKGTKKQPFFYPTITESLGDIKSIFEKMAEKFVRAV